VTYYKEVSFIKDGKRSHS